jgi:perosamine synthetase
MIPVAKPSLGDEELKNIIDAFKSGWISSKGEFIEKFEAKFARCLGLKYGIANSNGTTSLHLALKSLGIQSGDEVIVPTLTFVATANSVIFCNAKPIFVDCNPDYWCIDPEKIEAAITSRTKAIIPVHLYGHPCDMDTIMDVAKKHDLYIIEDAAEAHGAEYKGKRIGSFGDVSCFSFYGNKIITTGEGGMCLTNDEKLAEAMFHLRDHAMRSDKRYWHDVIGFNYRMTNLQAAIGVAQLDKFDSLVEKKRQIAKWYCEELKDLQEKEIIKLHPEMPWAKCVYWMYSILVQEERRDALMEHLKAMEIETRPFFYPMHVLPPHKTNKRYPTAEKLSRNGINLPSGVDLTYEDVKYIAKCIKKSELR